MKKKTITNLKKYKLKHKDIAQFFNYANENSFNNSSSKSDILQGVEELIEYIEDEVIRRIKG